VRVGTHGLSGPWARLEMVGGDNSLQTESVWRGPGMASAGTYFRGIWPVGQADSTLSCTV
jgi:hypothetical protein